MTHSKASVVADADGADGTGADGTGAGNFLTPSLRSLSRSRPLPLL